MDVPRPTRSLVTLKVTKRDKADGVLMRKEREAHGTGRVRRGHTHDAMVSAAPESAAEQTPPVGGGGGGGGGGGTRPATVESLPESARAIVLDSPRLRFRRPTDEPGFAAVRDDVAAAAPVGETGGLVLVWALVMRGQVDGTLED